jgi:ribosome biogenesis GTPase
MESLKNIGYNDWFLSHVDKDKTAIHQIARVIAVHKDIYVVTDGVIVAFAECSGNLIYTADSPTELPTTGDWVYADFYDDQSHAIIHGVITRKTILKRKKAGKRVDYQLIAANIDVALIVQSVDYNFNLRRLERYLVMVSESDISPVILLSKCDLLPLEQIEIIREQVSNISPGTVLIPFSNVTGENIDTIKHSLVSAHTYCLLGSSGVGKTTLLNSILGTDQFATQTVSKKENKGRHTTTHRELIRLACGALLVDTPGMRELGNISVDAGIDQTFSEIAELSQQCKFSNCSHINETGCAVLTAINNSVLDKQRYNNYLKMKKESAFNEMTYSEKKKKDKDFGKLIKSTMKDKKQRYH